MNPDVHEPNPSLLLGAAPPVREALPLLFRQRAHPALCFLTLLLATATAAGGQLSDLPPARLNTDALDTVPLDPARRAALQAALRSREYARAEALLVEEINRNPKSPQLLTLAGGIFFLDGKYLDCAIAMKKADALAPLDDRSRFTLAMAYITLNHRDWARPEIEKLALDDPRNALYPYWLSRLDYDAQRFTAAVAHAEKAIALDPNSMKAYDNLGLGDEALGRYAAAVQAYREAMRLNRESRSPSPWPALNLGALLVKLDRLDEAESCLRESLRDDPRFPQAHYQMGLLLEKRSKDGEAVEELKQAAALNPSYAEPYYLLGKIYRRQGKEDLAQTAWSMFQKLKKQESRERPH
jgi:tetratricopeptide (TPR) repeat protein